MSTNYYYLVSGLPDIGIDDGKQLPDYAAFSTELMEQVTPADRACIRMINAPFDNKNCIALLHGEEDEGTFDSRGNFSREELQEQIKTGESPFSYLSAFLHSRTSNKQGANDGDEAAALAGFFYHAMYEHPNDFIREWYTFDAALRNLVAGLNIRQGSNGDTAMLEKQIVTDSDIAQQIRKSSAADFSLSQTLFWADEVISAFSQGLTDREKRIDLLRVRAVEELTIFAYFGVEALLAYLIKLDIAHRWLNLDAKAGEEKLNKTIASLKSSFSMTEEL